MNILFIGDIVGKPGRKSVAEWLPAWREQNPVDFAIANGENAAGGKGVTQPIAEELFAMGIDVLTGGNHSFSYREALEMFDRDKRLLRPANLPPGVTGRGLGIYDAPNDRKIAVINLQGRSFMEPIDCPFRKAAELLDEVAGQTPIVLVDFHAEATSEKIAMTHWLDGRVSAVVGTHTHIPTADARILSHNGKTGSGYVTDLGMTGPHESVIGRRIDRVLKHMTTSLPSPFDVAEGDPRVNGVLLQIDERTGRTEHIERIDTPADTSKPPFNNG